MNKINGKVVSKSHRTLSADGKTLAATYVENRPDGTTVHESDVYARVSGSRGLVGEWRDIKVQWAGDLVRITTTASGRFERDDPGLKETMSGRTDGSPSAIKGPIDPPGATIAVKADNPRRWSYRISLSGKPFYQGVMTVSLDGKILTDRYWFPGKESEAWVAAYAKQ